MSTASLWQIYYSGVRAVRTVTFNGTVLTFLTARCTVPPGKVGAHAFSHIVSADGGVHWERLADAII